MINEIKRGDVFMALIETAKSVHVQKNIRPVVVIQNDKGNYFSPTLIVCPITSANKPKQVTHVYLDNIKFLNNKSIILCEQILTIDKTSLIKFLGHLDNISMKYLDNRIKISLQLD